MKNTLLLILSMTFLGCSNPTAPNDANGVDSCSTAVTFPNAVLTEKMVDPNYSGDLNNYVGNDTTKLDIKHTFQDGKLVQTKFYYINGNVQEEYHFRCQSLHGDVKLFFENGKVQQIIPYHFGKREGTGTLYDSTGSVIQRVIFENDSIIADE